MPPRLLPPLPAPLTLPALQPYVRVIVAQRNFTTDPNKVFILLVEEVGELTGEVAGAPARSAESSTALAHEVVDVLLYLVDLANGLEVELGRAWEAVPGPHAPLNALAAARRGADPAAALAALWEATGRLATLLRKRWKGLAAPEEAARTLAAAIDALLGIAGPAGIDLERAMVEKERLNATRTWTY